VSGYYRAPEIVLGLSVGLPIDMFSLGCCLYEFATGQLLFKSTNLNDHLRMIMEVAGRIPKKIVNQSPFKQEYFSDDLKFLQQIPGGLDKPIIRKVLISTPSRSITKEIQTSFKMCEQAEAQATLLGDLITKCVAVDPASRLTPEDAIRHPFFTKATVPKCKPKMEHERSTAMEIVVSDDSSDLPF